MTGKKHVFWLLVIVAGAALWTSVLNAQATARARIIHVASDTPAVDVYINGELAVAGLSYGEDSATFSLPAGAAELSATLEGTTSQLMHQVLSLDSDASAIIFSGGPAAAVYSIADDLNPLDFGLSRLIIVNALADGVAFDIAAPASEWLGGEVIAPGASLGPVELTARQVDFGLHMSGADGDAARHDFSAILPAGTSNLLLIHGDAGDPQLLQAAAAADADDQSGRVRFVHAVQDAAPVDLKVNDLMIIPALALANPSQHIAIPSGSHQLTLSLGGAVISSTRLDVNAGQMQTAAVMGSPGSLRVYTFSDSLRNLNESSAVVSLVNAVPNSSVSRLRLESGAIVAADVGFGEHGGAARIFPGAQSMAMDLEIGDVRGTVQVPPDHFYAGSYYNLIALAGSPFAAPRLLIAETSILRRISAAPSASIAPAEAEPEISDEEAADESEQPAVMPQAEEAPEAEAASADEMEPAAEPAAIAEPEADSETETASEPDAPADARPSLVRGPFAFVDLDPSARLQLRQYPSSDALSLGLLPGRTELIVLGRRGMTEYHAGETPDLPIDLDDYDTDPAAALFPAQDLRAADTWLFIMYQTADGGALVGWVNAYYLQVFDVNGGRQRLASLPMVRQNQAGSTFNTEMRPPDLADHVTARVYRLNPDALLNMRMANDPGSEILAQLPPNADLSLIGLDAADAWAFVDYEAEDNKIYRGWVSVAYLQLLLNGVPTQLSALRALDETVAPQISDFLRGSVQIVEAGGPTPIPLQDEKMSGIIGEIALDPGAMLHLRRHPTMEAESLALIPAGSKVAISGITENKEWLRTSYQDQEGWIAAHYAALLLRGRLYNRTYVESLLPLHDNRGRQRG